MKPEELDWRPVDDFGVDLDGFCGLEEIDDVAVVKEGNRVSFVKKEKKVKTLTPEPVQVDENSDEEVADFSVLADEKTELTSYGSWLNLNSKILMGLKKLGFDCPTKIQEKSIPLILNGFDVVGKASTGSGKTLAYSIPLLQRHLTEQTHGLEGLIISPTRELAHQIRDHIQQLVGKDYCVAVTGGLAIQKQLRLLSKQPPIVVATPGRLLEVLEQMSVKQIEQYKQLKTLILDEADRLIQNKSFDEIEGVMRILGVMPNRQVLVYSATFDSNLLASLTKRKRNTGNDLLKQMHKQIGLSESAKFVDADPVEAVASEVVQCVLESPAMEKDLYLYYFLHVYRGKTIVFVNSIDAVKRLVPLLKELRFDVFGVHSDMIQKQRLRSIERFKNGADAVLVATDVAARGLDVPNVDHVVHYHLPRTGDMYVHRSGRTARAGNMGVSVVLCSPLEASNSLPNLVKLISTRPRPVDVEYDILEKLKLRVQLAKKIADNQLSTAKRGKADAWLNEAANELGVDIDEEIVDKKVLNLKGLRSELNVLLNQKLSGGKYLTRGRNIAHELIKGDEKRSALEELKPRNKVKGVKEKVKEKVKEEVKEEVKEKAKAPTKVPTKEKVRTKEKKDKPATPAPSPAAPSPSARAPARAPKRKAQSLPHPKRRSIH